MKPFPAVISAARTQFHRDLVNNRTLSIGEDSKGKIVSIADKGQVSSRNIALKLADQLGVQEGPKLGGQTAGKQFECCVADFLERTFPHMQSVRPGGWSVVNVGGSRGSDHVSLFEPYKHLADLADAVRKTPELGAALGNSYLISPDILVLRDAVQDSEFNVQELIVDDDSGLLSPLRASNRSMPTKFVHAVISCKLTMRSDRAQNTRSESLNLLRNRKGRAPHIVAVTAEPSLTRITSLALGTGDIDMVYHFALPELVDAVSKVGSDESKELLETLVNGNRLRDIADLPIDLAV